ncbi:hypothetical protein ACIQWZ_19735 [Streptomyces sp. NPDC098077]|uniref:hypothetical protein n=1 Tax=Streptomyces sp. NPDC098077 TaxID=3366093 RepID=UPI003808E539
MEPVCHFGISAIQRLGELDLTTLALHKALSGGSADARMCTEMDAPGMAGYAFWSRSNRALREHLAREGWTYTNSQSILRTIHPSGAFAITAVSGSGSVGDENADFSGAVRTKNPKGSAIAKLVQRNHEQLPLFSIGMPHKKGEATDIPTWFLLYKSSKEGLTFELSLPVDMHGKNVDTWRERIILSENPFTGPEFDIKRLDEVPSVAPVEVPVKFKGAL